MITKEQIIEILNNHAGYMDRSRTEQAVHEDNFNYVADEILSKLSQHDVSESVCGNLHHFTDIAHLGRCEECLETRKT